MSFVEGQDCRFDLSMGCWLELFLGLAKFVSPCLLPAHMLSVFSLGGVGIDLDTVLKDQVNFVGELTDQHLNNLSIIQPDTFLLDLLISLQVEHTECTRMRQHIQLLR